jgi:predicted RecB family endonuclease
MTTEPEDYALQIARKLIADAIAQGFSISVEDDEPGEGDIVIVKSRDAKAIEAVLRTTSADTFRFYNASGRGYGWVLIIWRNGYDNPSNSVANATIDAICLGAEALANELSDADPETIGRADMMRR